MMKTKIKRVSKSTLSIILAIMMIMSTMLIGMVTSTAATVDDNAVGADTQHEFQQKYLYVDMSSANKTLQSVNAYWNTDCTDPSNNSLWSNTLDSMGNKVYRIDLSEINGGYLYFRGFKVVFSDNSSFIMGVWDSNKTYNCIKVNSSGNGGAWTTYSGGGDTDKDYYVAGDTDIKKSSFTNAEAKMSKNDAGIYSYKFTDINAGTYKFKITDGSTNWDVATFNNYNSSKSKLSNISVSNPDDYNKIQVKLSKKTTFTVFYDEANVYIVEEADIPQTYTVTNNASGVTVSKTSDITKGETIKITPSDNTKKITKVTGTNLPTVTYNDDGTATFTMPANNVTISSVTLEDNIKTYSVTYGRNNSNYGTISAKKSDGTNVASTTSVPAGTKVTFTATPAGGYKVEGWYSDSNCATKIPGTSATPTYTATINANTTVYVKFVKDTSEDNNATYKVYAANGSTIYSMIESPQNSGIYYSTSKVTDGWWFKVQKTAEDGTVTYSNSGEAAVKDLKKSPIAVSSWYTTSATNIGAYKNATDADCCLVYNSNDDTVYFVDNLLEGITTVYAKDCTFDINDGGKLGVRYGTTTVIDSDTSKEFDVSSFDNSHGYKTYFVQKGSYVTIRSTISSNYYKDGNGYYVAGFVVNGETVLITNESKDKDGNGIFDGYCVLDGVFVDKNSIVEITPVYFNRTIEANGDYVYFTVDSKEVPDTWGNTTSAYSYYYKAGTNAYEMDGVWPGQPLLKTKTGTYWTKVSKYYYDTNSEKVKKDDGSYYAMSGVAFSNYCKDYVHSLRGYVDCQTYDYNAPTVAIAQGYDTISFSTKYRNKTYNLKVNKNSFSPDYYQNGWDVFLNFNGDKKTDVLGNEVTDETKQPMYIVSTGDNSTSIGQWSTEWFVYSKNSNGTYTLVTSGAPSTFIDPSTTQYKAMNNDQYKGRTTYITYEMMNNKDDTANRIDGRWYYQKSSELEVSVYLQSQYYDESTNEYVFDNTCKSGTATIDGVAPDEKGISSKTFKGLGNQATIVATPKDGYVFAGWCWVDTKGGSDPSKYEYTELTLITEPTSTILVNSSLFLVARFKPVAHGSLVLTHSAKPGSGLGYYSITAQIKDKDNNNVGDPLKGSSVAIENISADQKVEVTLTTRMAGINVFENWYGIENGEYYVIGPDEAPTPNEKKEVSYTFTLDAADLFDGDNLLVSTLNYYSNITTVTAEAVLNYQYQDRNNSTKTYTTTVMLTPEYIEKNDYSLNNEDGNAIILDNAPAVEDLHKNVFWKIADQTVTYSGTTVTLKAEYKVHTYSLTVEDGDFTQTIANIEYNSLVDGDKKTDDNPYGFRVKAKGENFSYWIVTNSDGVEVGRTYSEYYNLRIVDDCKITAVYNATEQDFVSINDPTYTREQYTENGKQFDYLYADFILSYASSDGSIIRDNPERYQTGIVLEFDKNIKVSDADVVGGTVNYDSMTFDTSEEKIKYAIDNIQHGKCVTYAPDGSEKTRAIYNYKIDSSLYNNMNRTDYYLKFSNNYNFRHYVMKAYFYVVDTNTNETMISSPVYFNLYEIGNSSADV